MSKITFHIPSLETLRRKLAKEELQKTHTTSPFFPFYRMDFNRKVVVRFLPDGNQNNEAFWVEAYRHRINGTTITCLKSFNEECPVCNAITPIFKTNHELAAQMWRKPNYLYQGFVIETDPFEENPPANPIRIFSLTKQLQSIIEGFLNDPEIDEIPIHPENGRDFIIRKTRKGEWATYETSKFSMKTRKLTDEELNAINEYGLHDLSQFITRPTEEQVADILTHIKSLEAD